MQYRAAAWAGIATQFFFGGIKLIIFYVFYESAGMNVAGAETPMSFGELAVFVWMTQAFLAMIMLWSMDNELLDMIVNGNVVYELSRPLYLYSFWFSRIIAFRLARTFLRCFPILIVAFFLPSPWAFSLPPNPAAFFIFIPSIVLAALLTSALSMLLCNITFVTMNPLGARIAMGAMVEFFMGTYIPIPFMPPLLQRICIALPFRYVADFPFRVYSGNISGQEALTGLGIQFLWVLVLIGLGIWGFKSALKRLVVQGG